MAQIIEGVSFVTGKWEEVWKTELEKFQHLRKNDTMKKRIFFQSKNFLFVKYLFESEEYVILPMEFVENE